MKNKLNILTAIVVFAAIVLLAVAIITSLNGANSNPEGYYSVSQTKWPDNDHTKDIPEFDGDIYSVLVNNISTAVFAHNVEKKDADNYAEELINQGLSFEDDSYPKTAQIDDRYVTLAYNAETKEFSVTFSFKEESSQ